MANENLSYARNSKKIEQIDIKLLTENPLGATVNQSNQHMDKKVRGHTHAHAHTQIKIKNNYFN